MAEQITLGSLSSREAVTDALYRAIHGIDTNDHALLSSACVQDSTMTMTIGSIKIEGWSAMNEYLQRIFKLVTTHITSNVRVQIDEGRETARLNCHAIAYHMKPDDAMKMEDCSYTVGGLYDVGLVKGDDGLWRVRTWDLKILWTTGDRAILQ
jgi:hypothetical protein